VEKLSLSVTVIKSERTLVTRAVLGAESIDHPTTRRDQVSSRTAQYTVEWLMAPVWPLGHLHLDGILVRGLPQSVG
jgi:hypothetical protein